MKHVNVLTPEGAVTLKFTLKLTTNSLKHIVYIYNKYVMFYVSHRNFKIKKWLLAGYSSCMTSVDYMYTICVKFTLKQNLMICKSHNLDSI